MVEARATAKYVRGSPQKAKLVIDLIRGKRAADALSILRHTNKAVFARYRKGAPFRHCQCAAGGARAS